ncbi:hypothetical protein F2Q69_00009950 [Brassica cretica]|uniref:Glycosyltransferase n=1 Tax=Brassica cretica TaxID=69181 RepID=A0A8S9PCJ2_BRACR|nr:hypothetical protein F2Q69_00009950 [Brassica cretica]
MAGEMLSPTPQESKRNRLKPHIMVFPYPAQGHLLPLLDLTHQLCLHGNVTVSIIVTPKNLPHLSPLLSAHPSAVSAVTLPLPHSLSGVENVKDLGCTPHIMASLRQLREPIINWLMLGSAYGRRERACRRRSPSSFSLNYPIFVSSPSPPASALSKLWPTTTRGVSDLGVKTRLLGCYGAVKTLIVWVPIPGGGGTHSSVAAGSCVQEVEASSVSPSSALVSWGVGALALSDEISKSDEALRRVDRVGRTEVVSAEALRVLSFDEMKLR